jgi:hypothetical protein
MKPTAIQWLLKILEGQKDKPFDYDEWKITFEYALQIEKEQIIDAFEYAWYEWAEMTPNVAEQYYNKTFKSE